jgi:hypothetical protein
LLGVISGKRRYKSELLTVHSFSELKWNMHFLQIREVKLSVFAKKWSKAEHFWQKCSIHENPIIQENFKFYFNNFINPVPQPCLLLINTKKYLKSTMEILCMSTFRPNYVLTGVRNLRIKLWKSKQLIKTEEERKSKEKILLQWRLHKVI